MGRGGERASAGWAALRECRWSDARGLFAAEVAVRATAPALEGLAWAAWWLDDAPTLFDARERAHRLYGERGDALGAARVATWIAADELDFHGAQPVANGWLRRASRLLAPLDPCPEHAWLAFHQAYADLLGGDAAAALRHADRAARLGRTLGVADVEMLGLAIAGATLVAGGRVEEGMGRLDEAAAVALARDPELPVARAWTFCLLVTASMTVRDYERAFAWCDRVAAVAERYGSRYLFAFCRADYGALYLSRARWGEAEAALRASHEGYARSRPALAGGPLAGLAELRRRQGRRAQAAQLLDRAGETFASQLCRARLALDGGDARGAVELCERVLRRLPGHGSPARAAALEVLVRARTAGGEAGDAAEAAAAELRELAQVAGTPSLAASADLAAGLVALARGEHDGARALLEDAVDRFERVGAAFDAAQARVELATALGALGRRAASAREAGAALAVLAELDGPDAERARGLARSGTSTPAVTPRERDVLSLLAEGLTNQQIAERLVVSEHTVHRHVANILRKLDLPSRAAAAAYAVRSGVMGQPDA